MIPTHGLNGRRFTKVEMPSYFREDNCCFRTRHDLLLLVNVRTSLTYSALFTVHMVFVSKCLQSQTVSFSSSFRASLSLRLFQTLMHGSERRTIPIMHSYISGVRRPERIGNGRTKDMRADSLISSFLS